jgi:hypothetical protein
MKRSSLIGVFVLGFVSFLISLAVAQNKVVVVPLFGDESQTTAPAPVAKTGQNLCFGFNGENLMCSGTGQDGEYRRGAQGPTPRFTDGGDGTVTDGLTGLIWLKKADCGGRLVWAEALSFSSSLEDGDCGLSDGSSAGDWRLPNILELHSLIFYGVTQPALSDAAGDSWWKEGDAFNSVKADFYWSSTTDPDPNTSIAAGGVQRQAFLIFFGNGFVGSGIKRVYAYYVWPVRGGN